MEKNFKHLMVDIETLGTDVNAVVLSIGAVEFDIHTGETGRIFKQNVSIDSCLQAGLELNPETVAWWKEQSKESRDAVIVNQMPLAEALTAFAAFISPNTQHVWGNSARFDLGILQNCYNKTGLNTPWNYRAERCLRTLASMRPEIVKATVFEGVKHDALADCLHQIKYATLIYNSLNNNTLTPQTAKTEKKALYLQPVNCITRNPLNSSPTKYFAKDKVRLLNLYNNAKENNADLVFVNRWKKTNDVKLIFIQSINEKGVKIGGEVVTNKQGYENWLKDVQKRYIVKTNKTK